MLIITACFDMDPSDRDQFIACRTDQVTRARAADGCVEYALSRDALGPGRVRLLEVWRDAADLQSHVAARPALTGSPTGVTATVLRYDATSL